MDLTLSSDRREHLAVGPDELWTQLADVPRYPNWWPWLREFDGTELAEGAVWRCAVQAPVPYRLTFRLTIEEVEPARVIAAAIEGDIEGSARLVMAPSGDGTDLRLTSALTPSSPWVRTLTRVVRPLARWGHDWVIDTGLRQVRDHL